MRRLPIRTESTRICRHLGVSLTLKPAVPFCVIIHAELGGPKISGEIITGVDFNQDPCERTDGVCPDAEAIVTFADRLRAHPEVLATVLEPKQSEF